MSYSKSDTLARASSLVHMDWETAPVCDGLRTASTSLQLFFAFRFGWFFDQRVCLAYASFYGSEQEFVNTCVFAGFLSDRLLGPPMPPHLLHVRCRQCFLAFCDTFHVRTWPQLLSGHNPLKGRLKGARPVQNSSSQTATLLVRSHRGGPQILWLEIASGGHPPVNQSLTS